MLRLTETRWGLVAAAGIAGYTATLTDVEVLVLDSALDAKGGAVIAAAAVAVFFHPRLDGCHVALARAAVRLETDIVASLAVGVGIAGRDAFGSAPLPPQRNVSVAACRSRVDFLTPTARENNASASPSVAAVVAGHVALGAVVPGVAAAAATSRSSIGRVAIAAVDVVAPSASCLNLTDLARHDAGGPRAIHQRSYVVGVSAVCGAIGGGPAPGLYVGALRVNGGAVSAAVVRSLFRGAAVDVHAAPFCPSRAAVPACAVLIPATWGSPDDAAASRTLLPCASASRSPSRSASYSSTRLPTGPPPTTATSRSPLPTSPAAASDPPRSGAATLGIAGAAAAAVLLGIVGVCVVREVRQQQQRRRRGNDDDDTTTGGGSSTPMLTAADQRDAAVAAGRALLTPPAAWATPRLRMAANPLLA